MVEYSYNRIDDYDGEANETYPGLKQKDSPKRIVCLGDSITRGFFSSRRWFSYPAQLRNMINDHRQWAVINLGLPGTTVTKKSDNPYWF